jgi:hypothetical protein
MRRGGTGILPVFSTVVACSFNLQLRFRDLWPLNRARVECRQQFHWQRIEPGATSDLRLFRRTETSERSTTSNMWLYSQVASHRVQADGVDGGQDRFHGVEVRS